MRDGLQPFSMTRQSLLPVNTLATVLLFVNVAAVLLLPLRWAALPLLVGACYMTLGQSIELGPFHFPVIRILIAAGLLRVLLRGERLAGGMNTLDRLMLAWALWAVSSSLFHDNVPATLVNRLGLVYNACGIYFLLRVSCRSVDDVVTLCRIIAILLIPLSLEMYSEHTTGRNMFAVLGGVGEFSEVRNGTIRAQGPFAHSILAGSVGAVSLPLMLTLWRKHRMTALSGIAACLLMAYTSGSSGPVLSTGVAVLAIAMWPMRNHMRMIRWLLLLGYLALEIVMQAPAYYLLARIDVTGSSTSWHRSALIDATLRHFSEWWWVGTDYTRHWMDYGVGWSDRHIDVTNYYVMMGINGGLLLMMLFIAVLAKGFGYAGLSRSQQQDQHAAFTMWALGAALFGHVATMVSISYFDQSVVFLYVTLAAICGGYRSTASLQTREEATPLHPSVTDAEEAPRLRAPHGGAALPTASRLQESARRPPRPQGL